MYLYYTIFLFVDPALVVFAYMVAIWAVLMLQVSASICSSYHSTMMQ